MKFQRRHLWPNGSLSNYHFAVVLSKAEGSRRYYEILLCAQDDIIKWKHLWQILNESMLSNGRYQRGVADRLNQIQLPKAIHRNGH
jgi:hypothetical protein